MAANTPPSANEPSYDTRRTSRVTSVRQVTHVAELGQSLRAPYPDKSRYDTRRNLASRERASGESCSWASHGISVRRRPPDSLEHLKNLASRERASGRSIAEHGPAFEAPRRQASQRRRYSSVIIHDDDHRECQAVLKTSRFRPGGPK
ncbi:hypothetical protein C8J57DRAFT_1230286 [Mycena rebaudengoi]|nr:hypothetical protein C8J57DRAFT_1230286 [Mycena rebaudengoi]